MEVNAKFSKDSAVDDIRLKPESMLVNTASERKGEAKSQEVIPNNELEKWIRPEVILSHEIGVIFLDIGALDETKESL
ncbi:hypothetical protein RDI58_022037 [Solanum bulbocastanum]|uniref:Uncharacterized protein n=1 Tax=Solanum bulbocastanum TaxID=147425 RepID=A0AAN8T1B9_SOLBU